MSLPRIAIDAMGGDEGVRNMVAGVALAHQRDPKIRFLLVGDVRLRDSSRAGCDQR